MIRQAQFHNRRAKESLNFQKSSSKEQPNY